MNDKRTLRIATSAVVVAVLGWQARALPAARDGELRNDSAANELRSELSQVQAGAAWIGYEVPLAGEIASICCAGGAGCALEPGGGVQGGSFESRGRTSAHPELSVLLHVQQGRIDRVESFSSDCRLEAEGVRWVKGVRSEDSVALLGSIVRPAGGGRPEPELLSSALAAIARHADAPADRALALFVRPGESGPLRERAAMALAHARGGSGYAVLRRLLAEDQDGDFRRQVVRSLAFSDVAEAADLLLRTAREDRNPAVRGQALVSYARKVGGAALPVLEEAVANDPEMEVKGMALVALNRLPKRDGHPVLAEVAAHHRDPDLRHRAAMLLRLGSGTGPRDRLPGGPTP
ncbi:MAG TPA: HEAT repeat domain-containing protein [Thermoanaerobaculia bacterium]|nr:HEAT repeat domain-containing protein [Thermoanaerobaculia bacterium]